MLTRRFLFREMRRSRKTILTIWLRLRRTPTMYLLSVSYFNPFIVSRTCHFALFGKSCACTSCNTETDFSGPIRSRSTFSAV